jgi:hypothetical protein
MAVTADGRAEAEKALCEIVGTAQGWVSETPAVLNWSTRVRHFMDSRPPGPVRHGWSRR